MPPRTRPHIPSTRRSLPPTSRRDQPHGPHRIRSALIRLARIRPHRIRLARIRSARIRLARIRPARTHRMLPPFRRRPLPRKSLLQARLPVRPKTAPHMALPALPPICQKRLPRRVRPKNSASQRHCLRHCSRHNSRHNSWKTSLRSPRRTTGRPCPKFCNLFSFLSPPRQNLRLSRFSALTAPARAACWISLPRNAPCCKRRTSYAADVIFCAN